MVQNIIKIFLPTSVAFFIGIALTPFLTHYLYKYKMWKKRAGKLSPTGEATPIFNSLHKDKEVGIPRLGGVVIWSSVAITTLLFWFVPAILPGPFFEKLNFLSRNQTWLPLFTLVAASLVGLIDDLLEVSGRGNYVAGGLSFKQRLILVGAIGLTGALWFYFKLDVSAVTLPFRGLVELGWLMIPLFVGVMIVLFSSGVIDGLDGLAGGVMATIFAAYAGIALAQQQIDLAAFSAVISGGTLAFLWFNVPPARFYMSETGILGLTTALTVIAFLTDSVLFLPIIATPLTVTVIVNVLQLGSKKLRNGKKIFLVAPLHHHFEAIGWPAYKVVMRYWIIGVIFAIIGVVLTILGK